MIANYEQLRRGDRVVYTRRTLVGSEDFPAEIRSHGAYQWCGNGPMGATIRYERDGGVVVRRVALENLSWPSK